MNTSFNSAPERDMRMVRVARVVAVVSLTFAVSAMGLRYGSVDEASVLGVTTSDAAPAPILAVRDAVSAARAYYMPSEYDETKATDTESSPTF